MLRWDVLQIIIDARRAQEYLEIGVRDGECLFRIQAPHKTAVEPQFQIGWGARLRHCLANRCNWSNAYCEMTSDEFFARHARGRQGWDLVFVDGLHTYDQALRDIENALARLRTGGVVVVHDCNPTTAAQAFPAESLDAAQRAHPPGWTGEWCGDVWKAIVHLRSQRDDLRVCVLDCDYGLGLIRHGPPENRLTCSAAELAAMTYADLAGRRQELLNLQPATWLASFLAAGE